MSTLVESKRQVLPSEGIPMQSTPHEDSRTLSLRIFHSATSLTSSVWGTSWLRGTWFARLWDRFQVELHGHFSIQRIMKARAYSQSTTWPRILLVCLTTPLPALLVITLVDVVPLASPERSTNENSVYWIRLLLIVLVIVIGAVQPFRICIPGLGMRFRDVLLVASMGTIAGTAFVYGCSFLVGFPVPFSQVLVNVTGIPAVVIALYSFWREPLGRDPILRTALRKQFVVLMGIASITYVHAIYFFIFKSLSSYKQSAFTLLLPLIKIGFKNLFKRTLRNNDDLKPAFVVFNVDVFSSLYVANCLQTSQSWVNTLLVMLVDIAQISISMYDIRLVMNDIRSLVCMDKLDGSLLDLCVMSVSPPDETKCPQLPTSLFSKRAPLTLTSLQIQPSSAAVAPSQPVSSPSIESVQQALIAIELKPEHRKRLVQRIIKVLYIAEFVLLIEFTEVMIPIVYSIYLVAMSYLPNRSYYSQLANLDEDQLKHSIATVMVNTILELLSFIVTSAIISRQLGLSSLCQLAFALETQRELIQSSLMIWIPYIIQQSLVHNGVDFTFRFEWLRNKPL